MPSCPNGCTESPVLVTEKYVHHQGLYKIYWCPECGHRFEEVVSSSSPRDAFFGSKVRKSEEHQALSSIVDDQSASIA